MWSTRGVRSHPAGGPESDSPNTLRRGVSLLAALVLAGIVLAGACATPPASDLPAFVYNSERTLKAYQAALRLTEELAFMPCYCNCVDAHGHKDLKDCFFKEDGSLSDHAAFCEVCDWEAMDIEQWRKEGRSIAEVRRLIEGNYAGWGKPTRTPPVVEKSAS